MELDRVKLLKDAYMQEATRPDGSKSTLGEYMRLCLDGGLDLVTSKDLVVFDDDNEMAHAVCINEDMKSQASYPVKIISTEYSIIQQIETIMSQENFEKFLENGFFNISAEKKQAMIKWTRGIRNQAQQPLEAEPYFNTNPTIIPMAHSKIERDEVIIPTATVTGADGTVRRYKSVKDMMTDLKDGDNIKLNTNLAMGEETIDINNGGSVTLDLGGYRIDSTDGTAIKVTNGTLTVTNGEIVASGEAFRVDTREGGTAEIVLGDDVKVYSYNDCCIFMRGSNTTVTTSADLESKGVYAAVQGNGNDSGSVINVNGGSITGPMAIYHPQNGTLNINGGTFNGKSPLYIKAGEVNITDGKFVATGDAAPYVYNKSGGNMTGDAVVIDFCEYPGGMPKVNITGGEFTSLNAKAYETYYKEGNKNPEVAAENVKISGGVFDSKPYNENIVEGMSAIYNDITDRYTVDATPPTVIVGADGTTREYATAKEALADLQEGDIVTLKTDLALTAEETIELTNGANATIDLGGNTIEAGHRAFTVNNGALKISNGNIHSKDITFYLGAADGASVELTLDADVNIESDGMCCVFTKGPNTITTAANLSISGGYAAIQGNGNDLSEATINIIGGKIESDDTTVYLPSNATVNIFEGEIIGATGIYIKSGKLNIIGGKISGIGEALEYNYNNNGSSPTGDALVIDYCGYPAGDPKVTITGGELYSANSKAYETYDKEGNKNPEAYVGNLIISGGIFNTEPYAADIAEGSVIEHDPNANTYTVIPV